MDTITFREHVEALRVADEKFQAERDRRYAELATEREKALKIKETADELARVLVAENQKYKDEKANLLREQIGSERGLYVTKEEFKPIVTYIANQQGSQEGLKSHLGLAVAVVVILGGIFAATVYVASR